jgi:hypothetical protein
MLARIVRKRHRSRSVAVIRVLPRLAKRLVDGTTYRGTSDGGRLESRTTEYTEHPRPHFPSLFSRLTSSRPFRTPVCRFLPKSGIPICRKRRGMPNFLDMLESAGFSDRPSPADRVYRTAEQPPFVLCDGSLRCAAGGRSAVASRLFHEKQRI